MDKRTSKRFWDKVDKSGGNNACWIWTAGATTEGYGKFKLKGRSGWKTVRAHRLSYDISHGDLDNKLCVLHECDNPQCVNPAHLRQGTHQENMQDRAERCQNSSRGATNPNAVLSEYEIHEIRRHLELGYAQATIAQMVGVSRDTVHLIAHGKLWTHVTEHWTRALPMHDRNNITKTL